MNNTALLQATAILAAAPDIKWEHGDDLCDCTFQRIGSWTNPYLAKTMRVRLCCIWAEIYAQYPEYVQMIDSYYDENEGTYSTTPLAWDSVEDDMPKHLWHRHLAAKTGKTLDEIRTEYEGVEPPKAVRE